MKVSLNREQQRYNQYNSSFTARNPEIRFADDIVRKVNQEFPRLSNTKIQDFKNIDKCRNLLDNIQFNIAEMRWAKSEAFENAKTFAEKLLALTTPIKKFKVGNCGESAQLAEIAARVNGIKDCFCVDVLGNGKFGERSLDHAVLLVENNGKPYIIDTWLGFADYLPEAVKRYQKEYRKHFDFNRCINEDIHFSNSLPYDPTRKVFDNIYSKKELRKLYPELIINKR